MENFFKLKEHKTTVKTEVLAGITTFMAMAYILAVNPSILSASGMDWGAVFSATALSSAVATLCMGLIANMPFALSAGMGLNAFFTYTVVFGMGASWQFALAAVFTEGLIFLLLSVINVREAMFNAIPLSLKTGVSAGIGLFITIIALINAHILQDNASTLVQLIPFHQAMDGEYNVLDLQVCSAVLCLVGVIVTAFLMYKKVNGSILFGMIITWLLGIICQLIGVYRPNPDAGFYSVIPSGIVSMPASLAPTFGKFTEGFAEISTKGVMNFIVVMVSFLFVDIFDTLGTLIGCAKAGDMLNKEGRLHNVKYALLSDAIGTTFGAAAGTSTVTTFVESASGVQVGGRTGLTAIVTAILFLLAMFLWPIFSVIPSFATAPALIMVGFLMMKNVADVPWDDVTESLPAFLSIVAMPFFYSISEGIAFGVISYVVVNMITGNSKKVTPTLFVIAVLFVLKYILV